MTHRPRPDVAGDLEEVAALLRSVASGIQAPDSLRARRGALVALAKREAPLAIGAGWSRVRAAMIAVTLAMLTAVGVAASTLSDRWLDAPEVDERPSAPEMLPQAGEDPEPPVAPDREPDPVSSGPVTDVDAGGSDDEERLEPDAGHELQGPDDDEDGTEPDESGDAEDDRSGPDEDDAADDDDGSPDETPEPDDPDESDEPDEPDESDEPDEADDEDGAEESDDGETDASD